MRVGAIYPLSGTQGMGGIDEYHGVRVAAELVNADGGIGGRPVVLDQVDVPEADAAPGAIKALADRGVDLVLGSYGSTISSPAATAAAGRGSLFWETGAVGKLAGPGEGDLVFRVAPTGGLLGRGAIRFVADQLAPKLGPAGVLAALRHRRRRRRVRRTRWPTGPGPSCATAGLEAVADVAYDPRRYDPAKVVAEVAAARPDVLFVVAYLEDGVALRREQVRQHLPLLASIGTSSSYCMPEFGALLGQRRRRPVRLRQARHPRDQPGRARPRRPRPAGPGRRRLPQGQRPLDERRRPGRLLRGLGAVPPRAPGGRLASTRPTWPPRPAGPGCRPAACPTAAASSSPRRASADAGANLRAASVIWEWTEVNRREVTWPPQFATAEIAAIRPSR